MTILVCTVFLARKKNNTGRPIFDARGVNRRMSRPRGFMTLFGGYCHGKALPNVMEYRTFINSAYIGTYDLHSDHG
jgi:hypothetical protein